MAPIAEGLFKTKYLGEITETDFLNYSNSSVSIWGKLLCSNGGLFKRSTVSCQGIVIGPTLAENKQIIGDMLAIETYFFFNQAKLNPLQHNFYNFLLNQNLFRAKEYLLVMINATPIWREDIKKLLDLSNFLQTEENLIIEEKQEIEKAKKISSKLKQTISVIKKFSHNSFQILNRDYDNINTIYQDLSTILEELEFLKQKIINYIKKVEVE